jgi:RecB family exonuclease
MFDEEVIPAAPDDNWLPDQAALSVQMLEWERERPPRERQALLREGG